MSSLEPQPLEGQERWESASVTSRGGVYLAEMVLSQRIYSCALSLPSSLVSQLTPSQPQLTGRCLPLSPPASHSHPGTPWQPSYSKARVSVEPCALASHGAALGCRDCRQHCWVPRPTRLCLPSAGGFLVWPRSGVPPWQTQNRVVCPKVRSLFSPGCLPDVGKTPEASERAGLIPGDNWVATFYSQVRKKMLL